MCKMGYIELRLNIYIYIEREIYIYALKNIFNIYIYIVSFQCSSSLFLNWFTDSARTTSEGSPFQSETDLIEKL